jgi:hypothetical protein
MSEVVSALANEKQASTRLVDEADGRLRATPAQFWFWKGFSQWTLINFTPFSKSSG